MYCKWEYAGCVCGMLSVNIYTFKHKDQEISLDEQS